MKKIIVFICAVCLIMLCGCSNSSNYVKKRIYGDEIPWEICYEYKYKGHDYIKWHAVYQGSATHNPECTHPNCVKMRKKILDLE